MSSVLSLVVGVGGSARASPVVCLSSSLGRLRKVSSASPRHAVELVGGLPADRAADEGGKVTDSEVCAAAGSGWGFAVWLLQRSLLDALAGTRPCRRRKAKRVRRKSENKFENGSDDIGKHRTKSENKTGKQTAEIRKMDTQKSENQTDNIRKQDGPDQKTGRSKFRKQDKRKAKRATAIA